MFKTVNVPPRQRAGKVVAFCVATMLAGTMSSQARDLKVTTSWIGNTFSGTDKWVQVYVDEIEVSTEGTVYTASDWDEAGRCTGIYYNNGDVDSDLLKQYDGKGGHKAWGWGTAGRAVAIDKTYLYIVNTEGELVRFRRNDQKYIDTTPVGKAVGMTSAKDRLYIVRDNGDILVRRTRDLEPVLTFAVPEARDVAVDRAGSLWVLAGKRILHFTDTGAPLPETISDVVDPTALSLDNTGRLLVCENGPRRQVLFYDVTAAPKLVGTFGHEGGIASGAPGQVYPKKLFNLAGAATDASGNLYIALSGGSWDGTILRRFKPNGSLSWELAGHHFLDSAVVDPASDGTHVYASEEHYLMDYSKEPGKQWTLQGYTHDAIAFPGDPRRNDGSNHAAFARRVGGRLLLFMTNMYTGPLHVYYFTPARGEFALLGHSHERKSGSWGIFADKNGHIWEAGADQIHMTPFTGFDSDGKPQYGKTEALSGPAIFESLQRIQYFPDQDVMYLAGYLKEGEEMPEEMEAIEEGMAEEMEVAEEETEKPATAEEEVWGIVGKVVVRYDNWSKGNRKPTWVLDVPHDYTPETGPKIIMKAMAVEGDYLFLVGVETTSQVWVYRVSDGRFVGYLKPGRAVGGGKSLGWVDMPNALSAFRRKNGEYLIFVEEDARAKVIQYRWKPEPIPPLR